MKSQSFSNRHPVFFSIILMIIAFAAVLPFSIFGSAAGATEAGTVIGRLIIGIVLMIIFRKYFRAGRMFKGLGYMLPALLFPIWNIVYHLLGSAFTLIGAAQVPAAILAGLAPAVFEEVIFRGIMIGKLRESGKGKAAAVLISAVIFGLVHLTNIAGMSLINVLIQAAYAVVVGLLFGAIYVKSGDIVAVIIAHALTDISNHIFTANPGETSMQMLAVFGIVLVIAAVYAVVLMVSSGRDKGDNL